MENILQVWLYSTYNKYLCFSVGIFQNSQQ